MFISAISPAAQSTPGPATASRDQAIATGSNSPLSALAPSALLAALLALVTICASGAQACEKHLNGHQNGSDTQQEVQSGSQER